MFCHESGVTLLLGFEGFPLFDTTRLVVRYPLTNFLAVLVFAVVPKLSIFVVSLPSPNPANHLVISRTADLGICKRHILVEIADACRKEAEACTMYGIRTCYGSC